MSMQGIATTITQRQLQEAPVQPQHRVGIFGGTFDPPHIGQLVLAESIGRQLGLEKVYWMPNAQPVDGRHASAIAPADRVQMVRQAIMGNPFFDLELIEIYHGGPSLTYQTMLALTQAHPENAYTFIMGGDLVEKLPTWAHIDDLVQLVQLAAGKTTQQAGQSDYPIIWCDVPKIQISASEIRTKLRLNQSIPYLVPERVSYFIEEYHLYRGLYD